MTSTPDAGTDTANESGPEPRLRASDADRTATVAALQDAVGRGLLTHEEGGERMAAALSARFADELPPLTADLPAAAVATDPPPVGWRALGSATAAQLRAEVRTTVAAGLWSRRVLVAVLVVLALLGGLAALAGLAVDGLGDGGFGEHVDLDR
jgi:hypothetical protein